MLRKPDKRTAPGPSPVWPILDKFVRDEYVKLDRERLSPWAFFNAGKPMHVQDFYGRHIRYEGGGFEGSPRTVYWSRFIEPFLEDIASRAVQLVLDSCRSRGVDPRQSLEEARGLLTSYTRKAFGRMAEIDRRLRGRGFPERVHAQNTERYEQVVFEFINQRVDGELAALRRPPESFWSRANKAFDQHKLTAFLITCAIAIAGAAIKLL